MGTEDLEKHVKKAIARAAKGEFDQAISALHELTRERPDYLQAWTAKAVLYRLIGDDRMALLCSRTGRSLKAKEQAPPSQDLH